MPHDTSQSKSRLVKKGTQQDVAVKPAKPLTERELRAKWVNERSYAALSPRQQFQVLFA